MGCQVYVPHLDLQVEQVNDVEVGAAFWATARNLLVTASAKWTRLPFGRKEIQGQPKPAAQNLLLFVVATRYVPQSVIITL